LAFPNGLLCLVDSRRDLGLVPLIFRLVRRQLGRLRCDEPLLHPLGGGGVARVARGRNGQDESQKMSGVLGQNRIRLRLRDGRRTGDFGDAAHVVSRVGVLPRQHHVRRDPHLREEGRAVFLALGVQPHDAIVQSIGALARRHRRDVRAPHRGRAGAIVGRSLRDLL